MRRSGSNDIDSSGSINLTLSQIIWKKNREKRRLQNGKHQRGTRNQSRNPKNVRGEARESIRSVDATGKTREMDVPVPQQRDALHRFRRASGRDKRDGSYEPGRHTLQTAGDVSRDSASGKVGVHMGVGEIFPVGRKDQRAS